MTLKWKIGLGYLVILFLVLVSVISTGLLSLQVSDSLQRAKDYNLRMAQAGHAAKEEVLSVWQWLTDISATRGLDGLDDGFVEAEKSAKAFHQIVEEMKDSLKAHGHSDHVKMFEDLQVKFDSFYAAGKEMAQAYVDQGPEAGNRMMNDFDAVAEALQKTLNEDVKLQDDQLTLSITSVLDSVQWLVVGIVGIGGVILLAGIFFSLWSIRSSTGPIHDVIDRLGLASSQVTSASDQVSQSSQSLAEGTSELAANLEEASSTLEEIASMTRNNAENSQQNRTLAGEAREFVNQGGESMNRMIDSIQEIKDASNETAKIIKTIDEIAFQTNLLALNAAVEAARAGDAGRGFAVVAEEVRNLALRSAEAAKDTSSIIEASQGKADQGVKVAEEVNAMLTKIREVFERMEMVAGKVAEASEQQREGVDQINSGVAQMDSVTQANAANAEQTASASEELSSQSQEMMSLVEQLVRVVGTSAKARKNGSGSVPRRAAKKPAKREVRGPAASEERIAIAEDSLKARIAADSPDEDDTLPPNYRGLGDKDFV